MATPLRNTLYGYTSTLVCSSSISHGFGPIDPLFMWDTVSRVGIWCADQAFEVISPPGGVADGTNIRLALEAPPKKSRVG